MSTRAGVAGAFAMQCMEIWGGSHAAAALTCTPGLEIWVSSEPHDHAARGGDVHYVSLCGGGSITRLIVADLSGHGESAAEAASGLRALMRKNINRKDQSRLVRDLNRQFLAQSRMQRFATSVIATYLTARDTLSICNAGHPRPLWFHAESREWEIVSSDHDAGAVANLPLGIDDATPYTQRHLQLGIDDLIVIYTDALVEMTDPRGQQLRESGLLEIVRGLPPSPPQQFGSALLDQLAAFRNGEPVNDDQTIVVLRHNASHPRRLSLRQTLNVYAKVFGLKSV